MLIQENSGPQGGGALDFNTRSAVKVAGFSLHSHKDRRVKISIHGGTGGAAEQCIYTSVLFHDKFLTNKKDIRIFGIELHPDIEVLRNVNLLINHFRLFVEDINLSNVMLYVTGFDLKNFPYPDDGSVIFYSNACVNAKFYMVVMIILMCDKNVEVFVISKRWLEGILEYCPYFIMFKYELIECSLSCSNEKMNQCFMCVQLNQDGKDKLRAHLNAGINYFITCNNCDYFLFELTYVFLGIVRYNKEDTPEKAQRSTLNSQKSRDHRLTVPIKLFTDHNFKRLCGFIDVSGLTDAKVRVENLVTAMLKSSTTKDSAAEVFDLSSPTASSLLPLKPEEDIPFRGITNQGASCWMSTLFFFLSGFLSELDVKDIVLSFHEQYRYTIFLFIIYLLFIYYLLFIIINYNYLLFIIYLLL
jgi:hypothetical protein